ncbi:MAG: hypothetical protein JWN24_3815 [Phycisphaerales bacterium]|nr:hypothetical protein [Phycisphaerales bacterium]
MNSEMPNRDESGESVDRAISARLAKLRSMPVDLTNLEKALKAQIPPPTHQSRWRVLTLRPLRAIAASLVLASAIAAAILLSASSGPALAEAAQMAQVHQEIVSGKIPVMQVSSIDAANRMLNQEAPGAPSLPQLPDSHVMACCMKSVHNKKMACVLLKDEGAPVTLAVASAADMKLPTAPVQSRNGVEYRVQHVGDLSMVMTERNGKWLCLIGPMPAERLMDLAAQVRF